MAPARLSQELTGWPSGLTPAPCPVAPASLPALAADPSPWDALPRALASLLFASGARRGPASARGRGDSVLPGESAVAQPLRHRRLWGSLDVSPAPLASPLSPLLSRGRKGKLVLGSDSGETPPFQEPPPQPAPTA